MHEAAPQALPSSHRTRGSCQSNLHAGCPLNAVLALLSCAKHLFDRDLQLIWYQLAEYGRKEEINDLEVIVCKLAERCVL